MRTFQGAILITAAIAACTSVGCGSMGEGGSTPSPIVGTGTAGATSAPDPSASTSSPGVPGTGTGADPATAAAGGRKCRKELGCPAGAEIPKCAGMTITADIVGVTLADLNKNRAKFKGKKIGVSGVLDSTGPGSCTEMGCPADYPCCNGCTGSLVVGKFDPEHKTSLLLRSGTGDDLHAADDYACKGDETMVCCKYTPGGEVVAYGTLVAPKGDPNPYVLAGATLCRP